MLIPLPYTLTMLTLGLIQLVLRWLSLVALPDGAVPHNVVEEGLVVLLILCLVGPVIDAVQKLRRARENYLRGKGRSHQRRPLIGA